MAHLLSQEAIGYKTGVACVRQATAVVGGVMVFWHVKYAESDFLTTDRVRMARGR